MLQAVTLPVTPERGARADTNTNRAMAAAGLHELPGESPAGVIGSPNCHMRLRLLDRNTRHCILLLPYITSNRESTMPEPLTTTVSTKGQVVLPSAVRRTLGWAPGTRLGVVTTPGGVLLKLAPGFPETRSNDVFGRLACSGPPRSLSEMEAGVVAEAKRRHAGD